MTDIRQDNSEPAVSESTGSPIDLERAEKRTAPALAADSNRRERRRLIRAAVASVPVVLTFTAGKARAAQGSPVDSQAPSPAAPVAPLNATNNSTAGGADSPASELTPAEKLETFGLQTTDRPQGYSEDPFRDLDTVSDPVDLTNP